MIDLRGNEGGDDVGRVVLAHLIRNPVRLTFYQRLVRYRAVPADLLPYLSTYDPSVKDWGTRAVALDRPWPTAPDVPYLALNESDQRSTAVIQPAGRRFAGSVFVLVDSANSSATFLFEQTVRELKLGRLVGEPTGGNLRGINGGAFLFVHLPNSKIELDLPLIGTFAWAQEPDSGLMPDLLVRPTAEDIANGRDPALEAIESQVGSRRVLPSSDGDKR